MHATFATSSSLCCSVSSATWKPRSVSRASAPMANDDAPAYEGWGRGERSVKQARGGSAARRLALSKAMES